MSININKAAEDMKYLIDRGYNRETSLNLVVNRYHLNKDERNYLQRYVFSDDEIRSHKSKLIPLKEIGGKRIVIDGYNVLITVGAIINKKRCSVLVEGMDGILRDSSGIFSNYKFNSESKRAVNEILNLLSGYKPEFVLFIFDSQISKSGELSSYVKKRMNDLNIHGDSKTSRNADKTIIDLNWITATSDSIIIKNVDKVVDLANSIFININKGQKKRLRLKSRKR